MRLDAVRWILSLDLEELAGVVLCVGVLLLAVLTLACERVGRELGRDR